MSFNVRLFRAEHRQEEIPLTVVTANETRASVDRRY